MSVHSSQHRKGLETGGRRDVGPSSTEDDGVCARTQSAEVGAALSTAPPVQTKVAHPLEADSGSALSTRLQSAEVHAAVEGGEPLQTKAEGSLDAASVRRAALDGLTGSAGQLPHLRTIQRHFGAHDLSEVRSHVGGRAGQAARDIGASAYASGEDVAFSKSPDLHTAAHEAAHVVQQRAGVQLEGGVGKPHDRYEQQADAVADAVVSGRSAAHLLGPALDADSGRTVPVQARSVQRDAAEDESPESAQDAPPEGIDWDLVEQGQIALYESGGEPGSYYFLDGTVHFAFLDPAVNALLTHLTTVWLGEADYTALRTSQPGERPPWAAALRAKAVSVLGSEHEQQRQLAQIAFRLVEALPMTEGERFKQALLGTAEEHAFKSTDAIPLMPGLFAFSDLSSEPCLTDAQEAAADVRTTSCIQFVLNVQTEVLEEGAEPVMLGPNRYSDINPEWQTEHPGSKEITTEGAFRPAGGTARPTPGDLLILGKVGNPESFQHINFFQARETKEDGTEIWHTLDGGNEEAKKAGQAWQSGPARPRHGPYDKETRILGSDIPYGDDEHQNWAHKRYYVRGWVDPAVLFDKMKAKAAAAQAQP